MSNQIAPKLLVEFIGTFALIFIGAGAAAVVGDGAGLNGIGAIAFAHGLTVMAFAFAHGNLSGAHFNPAVTIGVLSVGAISVQDAVGYIVSQLAGGVAGAFLLLVVLGSASTGLGAPQLASGLTLGVTTTLTITPAAGFALEAVLAFFLVTVVLNTAVAGRAGLLAPFAIGMTLTLNIIMGGALTGAAFNPARALGPMIAAGKLANTWLYVLAPIVGAIIAACVYAGLIRLSRERTMDPGPASVAG
jgi:MIP family channel proteins